ncbi:hypothetical protein GCM10023231_01440 [Olivibacter ginsenosidimutans]|uniref:RCC1-like domain-containing protein n=1 Tax=Olivibacter ginsenosidimutans TaxID=1176537 RepID=A0ABP9ACJ2_9SPHI
MPPNDEGEGDDQIVQILAGEYNSFFLKDNGDLYAVGENSSGQLGNNSTEDITTPTKIMSDVKEVASGIAHTLILKKDGTVWGVGSNHSGQFGDGTDFNSSLIPVKSKVENVKTISAGGSTSFFLTEDGKLWGTGRNDYGQLGIPDDIYNKKTPALISEDVSDVSNSGSHTLFLKTNGDTYKMGIDTLVEGVNEDEYTYKLVSHPYVIERDVRNIYANGLASMMIKNDNTLWVRGYNTRCFGLGPDAPIDVKKSTYVISDILQVSTGLFHSMVIKSDSTVWVTGLNFDGQLGIEDTTMRTNVFIASNFGKASLISAGDGYSLFVKDGKIWGVGDNSHHQLSPSEQQKFTEPVLIELED